MRVSSLPTKRGEKIVIRIMDYSMSLKGLESLCFNDINYKKILKMISEPNGIILVTGATGTGKSTTVYSILQRLNSENTRVNKNGVDLNRNFPTKNWKLTEHNEYFGGEMPASEEETRFIINVVEKYNPKIILTIHAPYKVVNYDGPRTEVVEKISQIMNYPIEESIGYPTPGSFGTWAGIEKKILTITLELDEEIDVKEIEAQVFRVFELLEGA
jgi:ABC-type dipeptide/oligopeptide/nickel transport system ATPase component